jgi:ribosomal protein S18 acetylase RimI-like enzyme
MHAHDWRICSGAEVAPLYDAEISRWMASLHWDTGASWALVEAARVVGGLPGFVARDGQGAIRGWTFYLRHDDALQVGAFVADSPAATAALLDAITGSAHAASASALVLFAFSTAPDLTAQLGARGFAVERYRYLEAALPADAGLKPCATDVPATVGAAAAQGSGPTDVPTGVAQGFSPACWSPEDQDPVAGLLARAYPSLDPARPFARRGEPHEWVDYVRQLTTTTGCGTFLPHASVVVRGAHPGRADAATLVTRLSADTVHLAQIAVSPDARRRGLASRLIAASLAAALGEGCTRATLLVGEHNPGARRLYDRLGFEEAALFVSAVRDQPRRSTSAALETGGAITLR